MVVWLCRWMIYGIFLFLPAREPGSSPQKHPFFITVTEINHNAKEKAIEISCKIFTDDFETTLAKFVNNKIDLSDQKKKEITDKYIAEYIVRHLQLKVDDKPVILQFVGSEKEAEATWSYFQVNAIPSLKKIEITDDLLYESFENQIGIIHVMVNGNRQSTKLNRPDSHAVFEF